MRVEVTKRMLSSLGDWTLQWQPSSLFMRRVGWRVNIFGLKRHRCTLIRLGVYQKMSGCSVHSHIMKECCVLLCTKKQNLSIFNSFKLCVTLCTYCMYSCKLHSFFSKDGKHLYKDVYVDCCPTYRLPIYTVEFTRSSLRISHFSSAFKWLPQVPTCGQCCLSRHCKK